MLTVPGGGEPILIRELSALGVEARTRTDGEVQLRARPEEFAEALARTASARGFDGFEYWSG